MKMRLLFNISQFTSDLFHFQYNLTRIFIEGICFHLMSSVLYNSTIGIMKIWTDYAQSFEIDLIQYSNRIIKFK